MNAYILIVSLIGFIVFLKLSVRVKVLVAVFVMTQCFDLAPPLILGQHIWDYGATLLLIAGAQLMLIRRNEPVDNPLFILVLRVFTVWMFFCLFYSLFIYGYPVLNTLKEARQMIIGYLAIFIFLRLFAVDKGAFDAFIKWIYIVTFALLVVAIIQYVIGTSLLFGLQISYGDVGRYVPSYLALSLVFFWYILTRYFFGEALKKHEYVYAAMTLVVTALTYTRGIYITVVFVFMTMLILLFKRGKIKTNAVIGFCIISIISVAVLTASGSLDRVIGRAASGLNLIVSDKTVDTNIDSDTFTGRLLLVKERFELVAKHNPVMGYGFAHQNDLPEKLIKSLKYGSVVRTTELREQYAYGKPLVLALFSADIGWGNIALATGFVGFILFVIFGFTFIVSIRKHDIGDNRLYHFRLAFYLQAIGQFLLMFNGSPFTSQMQLTSFIIAGYVYCGNLRRNASSDDALPVSIVKSDRILCRKKSQS